MARSDRDKQRRSADPLQVNLRWLVGLLLGVVVLPTAILTGIGIVLLATRTEVRDVVFGILVVAFAVSVIAGSFLLVFLAQRGARLARTQETFLSHVSHELRTPIAGIRLHAQLLAAETLGPDAADSVESIQRESDRLQQLVERLLIWRQLKDPKQLYKREPVKVQEVIARVLQIVGPRSAALKLRIRHPDAVFIGDLEAFSEAVANLVQNAFKYAGDAEPIELSVQRFGPRVIFSVRDRGPGLPAGSLERLFDPFFRVVSADRPDPGGVGLGLTIAQEIARVHGGRLATLPRKGRGTRFYIVVPAVA